MAIYTVSNAGNTSPRRFPVFNVDLFLGPSQKLTSRDLTTFCYQVARGMEYLAAKKVIHRDLAARNILVDHMNICKVSDFGFSRDVMANNIYERKSEGRLPIRWMAPEALYDNIYTT